MDTLSFILGFKKGSSAPSNGGSGGSLPAGLYWKQSANILPATKGTHFMLGGKHYFFTLDGSKCDMYVETADGYEKVISQGTLYKTYNIELNNKIHFCAGIYHHTFDGETLVELNHAPTGLASAFVWENNVYATKDGYDDIIYKWDESTDTWTQTSEFSRPSTMNGGAVHFVHNGELYAIYQKKIYKYTDNVASEYKTIPDFPTSVYYAFYTNGYIYCTDKSSTGVPTIYRYNMDTDVCDVLGKAPYQSGYHQFLNINGKMCFVGEQDCMTFHYISE